MRNKKGQSLIEHAALLCTVMSVIMIMQFAVQRSYQGRLKEEADSLGPQYAPGNTNMLEVRNTTTHSVSYTGGVTNSADLAGVIPGGHVIPDGMTVTYASTDNSNNTQTAVDAFAAGDN